jgi:hypothetical protein
VARGMDREHARREAIRSFQGIEQRKRNAAKTGEFAPSTICFRTSATPFALSAKARVSPWLRFSRSRSASARIQPFSA